MPEWFRKRERKPLYGSRIEDYAVIGDLETAALIYRWLRGTSFTLLVLMRAGNTDEAIGWRLWLLRAIAGNPDQLQTLYGLGGERKLFEWEGVALDRAVKHYERYDGAGDVKRWRKNRDRFHAEICRRGFNKRLNSFTQSYGSRNLDASCLRLLLVGFLSPDDPRIIGTIDAVQKHLMKDGLVLRYRPEKTDDGLNGGEGAFLARSFWLVTCLWLIDRQDQARKLFDRLFSLANDVGLLSEEYDAKNRRMPGNFPQALSPIALARAAFTVSGQWHPEPYKPNV